MKPNILFKDSTEKVIELAADHFYNLTADSTNKFNFVLSGGNTPKLLFKNIVDKYASNIDWAKINLWWGDERCVPPSDAESNYGMAKKFLIDLISIPEKNIFRIRGEADAILESQIYGDLIDEIVPKYNAVPQFDLIYLGLGEDGHTASIFPDSIALFNSPFNCVNVSHPVSKQERISITGRVINNAKNVFMLITGKTKSKIVDDILNGKNEFQNYPAALINPVNGNYSWYLDDDAAALLEK